MADDMFEYRGENRRFLERLMAMKISNLIICGSWISALSIAAGCSAGQTESETEILKVKDEQQVSDPAAETTLKIETKELRGTEVTIAPGTIAAGSNVSLNQATTTPKAFEETGLTSANKPVDLTIKDESGNAVEEVGTPLTIQLPINSAALQAVDSTTDNLCVLLVFVGNDDEKYVWRRSALTLKDEKAIFKTTKLGTFQLVYCGSETLSGFEDAAKKEIAGDASSPLVRIKVPTEGFKFGHTHICAGIRAKNTEGVQEIWAFNDHFHEAGSEIDLKILKGGLKPISSMSDDTLAEIFIVFQTADQKCNASLFKAPEPSSITPIGQAFYAFTKLAKDIKKGEMDSTLGDASGSFPLEKVTLKIGRSDGGSQAASNDIKACVGSIVEGGSGGIVEKSTTIGQNYQVGGGNSIDIQRVKSTNADATKREYITFNSPACFASESNNVGVDSITQKYTSFFRNTKADSTIHLAPMNMKLNLASGALYSRVCIQIFPKGATIGGKSDDAAKLLSSVLVSTSIKEDYKIYVPFQDNRVITLGYKGFTSGSDTCASTTAFFFTDSNQALQAAFEVTDAKMKAP